MEGGLVSNDAARHDMADALAMAQEQIRDLVAVQQKRAKLTVTATVADGTVEVTVNSAGMVLQTVIDETYLDDHDFAELGDYVTQAAQSAIQQIGRKSAELLAPLTERRNAMPALSDIVPGAPDLRDLMPDLTVPHVSSTVSAPDAGGDDWPDRAAYPNVRS